MSQQSTSGIPIPKRHHDAGPKGLLLAGALDDAVDAVCRQKYDAHMDVNDGTRQGWPSDHRPMLVEFG